MSITRIASRYAKSLMDFSKEKGNVDVVLEDVKYFKAASENNDLKMMLKSPIIIRDRKKKVFDALFNDKLSETTRTFLNIVLSKGREQYLPEIASQFILQYKEMKHVSAVKITTATKLDAAAMDRLQKELLGSKVTDENVEIETFVDPSIIGGYILEIGDKLYNASVAHKLDNLRKEFSGNQYEKAY